MSTTRWMFVAFGLAATLLMPPPAHAQGAGNSCQISVTSVIFGTYNVFSGSPVQSTGSVTISCGPAVPSPIRVSLDEGQSGTYSPRELSQGGETLAYNLYTNAARTQIWGNGTSGTFDVFVARPAKGTWSPPVTIYGEIPAAQDVSAGTYTDNVTAIVNF